MKRAMVRVFFSPRSAALLRGRAVPSLPGAGNSAERLPFCVPERVPGRTAVAVPLVPGGFGEACSADEVPGAARFSPDWVPAGCLAAVSAAACGAGDATSPLTANSTLVRRPTRMV